MRAPRVSGPVLIRAFLRHGWNRIRTNGSHYILSHPRFAKTVCIPYTAPLVSYGVYTTIRKDTGLTYTHIHRMLRD